MVVVVVVMMMMLMMITINVRSNAGGNSQLSLAQDPNYKEEY